MATGKGKRDLGRDDFDREIAALQRPLSHAERGAMGGRAVSPEGRRRATTAGAAAVNGPLGLIRRLRRLALDEESGDFREELNSEERAALIWLADDIKTAQIDRPKAARSPRRGKA